MVARSEAGVEEAASSWDGSFRLEVPPGQYVLTASRGAESSLLVGPVLLAAGSAQDGLLLELLAASSVFGAVFDAVSRQPIPGATVRSSGGACRTDHAGRFQLSGLPAGETWLEATAEGHVARAEWLILDAAREYGGMELFLKPAAVLEGRVLRQGKPLAGAPVWAEAEVVGSLGRAFGPVRSAEDGSYRLWAEDGALVLAAAAPGGSRVEGPRVRIGGGGIQSGLDIELGQPLSISGIVLLDGRPAPGVELWLLDARSQRITGATFTSALGDFHLEGPPPGSYLVQVRAGALTAQRGPFSFTGEPGEPWTVELASGRSLEGRVTPRGAGTVVRLQSGDWAGPMSAEVATDAEGRFRFDGVPDGALAVEAEGEAGVARAVAHAGEKVLLSLRPAVLRGSVADERGAAVSDFTVRLRPTSGGPTRAFPVLSPSGDFRVQAPPGEYEVSATASGHGETSEPTAVRLDPAGAAVVRLRLTSTVPLRGVVLDAASGAPLPGVEVAINRMGPDRSRYSGRWATLTTGADGEFRIAAAPGRAMLSFRSEGYVHAWAGIEALPKDAQGRLLARLRPGRGDPMRTLTEYEGIGAQLDQPPSGEVKVRHVFEGGPAEAAGLLPGDEIVAVDGQAIRGLNVYAVIDRIIGPAGTVVRLTVARGPAREEISIRRRQISF